MRQEICSRWLHCPDAQIELVTPLTPIPERARPAMLDGLYVYFNGETRFVLIVVANPRLDSAVLLLPTERRHVEEVVRVQEHVEAALVRRLRRRTGS